MDDTKTSSCSITAPEEASNFDELLMRQGLTLADNLKELKNLSTQLYSAAEHFELSYSREHRKQLVVETAKEYVTNAIVNTVDHLGSVAYKVTNFLDEKVDEFSGTELQFSCMEQRLQACQELRSRVGVSQHSLLTKTPTCHKRYIIPNVRAKRAEPDSSLFRKEHSSLQPSSPGAFSFSKIVSDKELVRRTDSPQYFQLKRSGTLVRNSILSTNSSAKQPYPEELRRSASMSTTHSGRSMTRDIQPHSKKSKPLFKALFTMLKQKRDGKLGR
ncbi:protein ABIL3-like isoform X2 [Rhododendron vialii]|nr:protein ABIL3-like isoform X2 [Rhododendron vialii]